MKQLTAFEAPSVKAMLVPVEIDWNWMRTGIPPASAIVTWNKSVRRWHRTGGQP